MFRNWLLNSNLNAKGNFLEYVTITEKGEYTFNNIITKAKYIYAIMTVNEFYIQPMTIPTYSFSYGNEYVSCYNDGISIFKFGFKAINNVLHIYIKQVNNFSSIACFGFQTEKYPLVQFNYKATDLTDDDMDKIV